MRDRFKSLARPRRRKNARAPRSADFHPRARLSVSSHARRATAGTFFPPRPRRRATEPIRALRIRRAESLTGGPNPFLPGPGPGPGPGPRPRRPPPRAPTPPRRASPPHPSSSVDAIFPRVETRFRWRTRGCRGATPRATPARAPDPAPRVAARDVRTRRVRRVRVRERRRTRAGRRRRATIHLPTIHLPSTPRGGNGILVVIASGSNEVRAVRAVRVGVQRPSPRRVRNHPRNRRSRSRRSRRRRAAIDRPRAARARRRRGVRRGGRSRPPANGHASEGSRRRGATTAPPRQIRDASANIV